MSLPLHMFYNQRIGDQMTEQVLQDKLLPAYSSSLDTIRADVGKFYERYAKDGQLSWADVTQYNRLNNLEKQVANEMTKLGQRQQPFTRNMIKDVYQESYYRNTFALHEAAGQQGLNLSFSKLPESQVKAAVLNPLDRIGWPGRTAQQITRANQGIQQAITRGIIEGKHYEEMARDVANKMGKSAREMERIVRTEGHRAREVGNLDALHDAYESGLNVHKQWLAARDERVRNSHRLLDSETVKMNEEFTSPVTGAKAEGPGGFGIAEEDINCRCTVVGVFPGEEFEAEKYKLHDAPDDYVGHYESYTDWARKKGIDIKVDNWEFAGGVRQTASLTKLADGTLLAQPVGMNVNKNHLADNYNFINNSWNETPKYMRREVNQIQILDYRNPQDPYWAVKYNKPDFRSFATGGRRQIHFYENGDMLPNNVLQHSRGTLVHEAAHNVDTAVAFPSSPGQRISESVEWKNAIQKDVHVSGSYGRWTSEYARSANSTVEDFADAYRALVSSPDAFKNTYPNRFKIMEQVRKYLEGL